MGVFEVLHGEISPRVFAEKLKKIAVTECYGTALPAFLEKLIEDRDRWISRARYHQNLFVGDHQDSQASAEVGRMVQRFAIVAAAGEVATEMEITGWMPGEAYSSACRCFQDWIHDRGGLGQSDVQVALERARELIESGPVASNR
jgi:putative DNA primase/helicase